VTPRPGPVLVAEDDPDDRLLAREAFAEAGGEEPRFVCDGAELLDYLRRRGSYAAPGAAPRPGLIVLDLNMPRRDGRWALAEIKGDPALAAIPLVVMSTSRTREDVEQSYRLGADGVTHKPAAFAALVEVMRSLLTYRVETEEPAHDP
jgi:CheY-like chemotaxis protein